MSRFFALRREPRKPEPVVAAPTAVAPPQQQVIKTVIVHQTVSNAGVATGLIAAVFALLGIFSFGLVFLPFAVLFAGISLIRSILALNTKGMLTALFATILTVLGFVVSPTALIALLALLGSLLRPN
jgi:preprotein translocase subunit SecF